MPRIRDLHVVVIDTETTGLKPEEGARVIELAMVRLAPGGDVIEQWATLLNPGTPIPAETTAIHGLTDLDLVDAPTFTDVADAFTARLQGCVVVGHNIGFDWGFLTNEYRLAGRDIPQVPLVDTLEGARKHLSLPRHRLGMCCEHLGIDLTNWHAALADTMATSELLYRLLDLAEAKGRGNVTDLDWFQSVLHADELPAVHTKPRAA